MVSRLALLAVLAVVALCHHAGEAAAVYTPPSTSVPDTHKMMRRSGAFGQMMGSLGSGAAKVTAKVGRVFKGGPDEVTRLKAELKTAEDVRDALLAKQGKTLSEAEGVLKNAESALLKQRQAAQGGLDDATLSSARKAAEEAENLVKVERQKLDDMFIKLTGDAGRAQGALDKAVFKAQQRAELKADYFSLPKFSARRRPGSTPRKEVARLEAEVRRTTNAFDAAVKGQRVAVKDAENAVENARKLGGEALANAEKKLKAESDKFQDIFFGKLRVDMDDARKALSAA